MLDRRAAGLKLHSLIDGRHKSRPPVSRTVHNSGLAVLDHHKARQIAVQRAHSVGHPRAERRPAPEHRPRVHRTHTTRVIDPARNARANHHQIVRVLRYMLKPVRDPQSALTALFPLAFAFQKRRFCLAHRSDRGLETLRQRLARKLVQKRLRIKGVQMTRAAFHEQENHLLRAPLPVTDLRGHPDPQFR